MTIKIITDTLSDITADVAAEMGITLVPLYVRFGEEVYRDRVEITAEDFYTGWCMRIFCLRRRNPHRTIFLKYIANCPGRLMKFWLSY